MPTDCHRFDSMIDKYVHDPSNQLLDKGRELHRIEVTSLKNEYNVGWEVVIHYHRPDDLTFIRRLRHKSFVKHYLTLEKVMGWMWEAKPR